MIGSTSRSLSRSVLFFSETRVLLKLMKIIPVVAVVPTTAPRMILVERFIDVDDDVDDDDDDGDGEEEVEEEDEKQCRRLKQLWVLILLMECFMLLIILQP
jgi:hypothetical protein